MSMRRTSRRQVAVLLAGMAMGAGALWTFSPQPLTAAPPAAVTPKMQAPPEARSLSRAFSGVAKALRPSVVRLDVEVDEPRVAQQREGQRSPPRGGRGEPDLRDFFERFFDFGGEGSPFPNPGPGRGTGSGVLLDTKGNILTNSHVVSKATKLKAVFSDGSELPAKVIGKDELTDVAVVQLEKPPANLVVARLGDSDKVEIGEWVLAVGSPLGMDQTRHRRHRQQQGQAGPQPDHADVRREGARVHPDRRQDQPGQLGWSAGQPGGRGHRHQHADQHRSGRRLRLRHPDQPGPPRGRGADQGRADALRLPGRAGG